MINSLKNFSLFEYKNNEIKIGPTKYKLTR